MFFETRAANCSVRSFRPQPTCIVSFQFAEAQPVLVDAFPFRWEPNPAQEIVRLFFSADDT